MNPISKDLGVFQIGYYSIAPCTFELLGGKMKPGDPLLTSRPPRICKVCGSPDKVISTRRMTPGKWWFR